MEPAFFFFFKHCETPERIAHMSLIRIFYLGVRFYGSGGWEVIEHLLASSLTEEPVLRGQAPAAGSQMDRAGQPDQQLHGLRALAPALLQSHHPRPQQPFHTR